MNPLEGRIEVTLYCRDNRVDEVAITNQRPRLAAVLLRGLAANAAPQRLRSVYSLCGSAQEWTARIAIAAARGETPPCPEADAAIGAEMLREHLVHTLLDWPRLCGEAPDSEALAALPHAPKAGWNDFLQRHLFGLPPQQWLKDDWGSWAAHGATPTARLLHRLLDEGGTAFTTRVEPLRLHDADQVERALIAPLCDREEFAVAPQLDGCTHETGALARQCDRPQFTRLRHDGRYPLPARLFARLAEIALLADGNRCGQPLQWRQRSRGEGFAWSETARGTLLHWVRLDGERIEEYRLLAPTEWNFHPCGVLAEGLRGAACGDETTLRRDAEYAIAALDPCVHCTLEVVNA